MIVQAPLSALAGDVGFCELEDGARLHPEVARKLTCDSRLQTLLSDGSGEPIDIGRVAQSVPPWLKRLVTARDRTCTFPGCEDLRYTEAHHIRHWALGGPTDLDNLVLVCGFHHKAVHEYRWSVHRRPDGSLEWFRPGGRLHGVRVPRPRGPDPVRPSTMGPNSDRCWPSEVRAGKRAGDRMPGSNLCGVTNARAVLLVVAVSIGSAVVLALVSRTPASVRRNEPPVEARDPSLGAEFTDEQIARHGAYRRPGYLGFALSIVVEVTLLVALARGPWRRIVDALEGVPGGWPVRALILGAVAAFLTTIVGLPLAYVRGYAIQHAWGLSTQDLTGWLADVGRSLGIGAVIAALSALVFFAVVRWQPRAWWIIGWGAFTVLTALMTFLYPIVIAPLFNKFTPLEAGSLRERSLEMARAAGVDVDEVLVADASRRTTSENAYVAGLGSSKRLVLYDTLIAAGEEDETLHVVAHELGHRSENHVAQNVVIASAGLLIGFGALLWLSHRSGLWAWGGASGIADLRVVPLLLLFALAATLVLLPVENLISRKHEAKADRIALDLTEDPETAIRTFRRLAFSNLADLRPPDAAVWMLYTHPPIPERIEAALQAEREGG